MKRLNLKYITAVLCVTSLSSIFLLSCSNKSIDENVYSGTVECTEYDVQTEISGTVNEITLKEGSKISKGDVVAKLDDTALLLNLKQSEAAYKINKEKYEEAKAGTREEQLNQAEANLNASKAKLNELVSGYRPEEIKQGEIALSEAKNLLEQAQKNYNLKKENFYKYKTLESEGIISQKQLDEIKSAFDVANTQLVSANNSIKTANEKLSILKNGPTKQSIEAAQAAVKSSEAQYNLLKNGNSTYVLNSLKAACEQSEASKKLAELNLSKSKIKSPITGTILKTWINSGELVSPSSIILTVADLNDLWVKIYVPQKYFSQVSLNKDVKIKCSNLEETINGKITYISSNAEFTPKNTQLKEDKQEKVFEVKVKILDHLDCVKPGMDLEVIL